MTSHGKNTPATDPKWHRFAPAIAIFDKILDKWYPGSFFQLTLLGSINKNTIETICPNPLGELFHNFELGSISVQ